MVAEAPHLRQFWFMLNHEERPYVRVWPRNSFNQESVTMHHVQAICKLSGMSSSLANLSVEARVLENQAMDFKYICKSSWILASCQSGRNVKSVARVLGPHYSTNFNQQHQQFRPMYTTVYTGCRHVSSGALHSQSILLRL
jgi:hypothetical protein